MARLIHSGDFRFLMFIVLFFAALAWADDSHAATVGVKVSEPFVMHSDGSFNGSAIELWENASGSSNHDYVEYPTVDALLQAVEEGEVEVAVGPITVTGDREAHIDFTQPFYQGGLSYAVEVEPTALRILMIVLPKLMVALAVLAGVLLVIGFIYAKLEDETILDGVYWAVATFTTVGYGDKSAETRKGKMYSILAMLGGVFWMGTLLTLVTGAVAVANDSFDDFNILSSDIAVISGSAGSHYVYDVAQRRNVHVFATVEQAVEALHKREVDAIVHDKPILEYVLADEEHIIVCPESLTDENYAFAVQTGDQGLDSLNVSMLKFLESNTWKTVVQSYH